MRVHAVGANTEVLDVLGVTVELLTNPAEDGAYCVMKGSIPPSMAVPLHSHPDAESFYVVSGSGLALVEPMGRLEWLKVIPGDFLHGQAWSPGIMRMACRMLSDAVGSGATR